MVDLFACNVTVQIDYVDPAGNSTVAGYLFASQGEVEGAQEQRWVLNQDYMPLPDKGTILFRTPPARLCFTTLAEWQEAVRAGEHGGLWKHGSAYVKAASMSFYKMVDPAVNAPAYPTLTLESSYKLKIRKLPP